MTTDTHKPARPMKYFTDKDGYGWLCDKGIDPNIDLRRLSENEIFFPRSRKAKIITTGIHRGISRTII